MESLKNALELLDEAISDLEDKIGLDASARFEAHKKHIDALKQSRSREASALAVAQKVASRLDQTIDHVEVILRS